MANSSVFRPVKGFSFEVNRSERTQQVRLLVPLLARPDGRAWFLQSLKCPCGDSETRSASVYHLCFPLRDIFTADYYQCRGLPRLEDQFIAYYNRLFGLPEDFGIPSVWRTAPGGQIRHPGAVGRAGWYDDFLRERIRDEDVYRRARDVRRLLGTEADALVITENLLMVIECKYRTEPSLEQHERHKKMGAVLAARLDKTLHLGMVVNHDRDPSFTRVNLPYVLWSEIERWLGAHKA